MNKKVKCMMLVDDNPHDNFFHERVIKKSDAADVVIVKESAEDALDYLKSRACHERSHPNIIFLDINMPGMNGWEFIDEYKKLDKELQSKMVVIMLTTSDNLDAKALAKTQDVIADFKTKPITEKMLVDILHKYYSDNEPKP